MKASLLWAVAAYAAQARAQLQLPFTRQSLRNLDGAVDSSLKNRRSTADFDFFAAENLYIVNVTVGTPPQKMSMLLNVHAAKTWVPDADYCDTDGYSTRYGWCKYGSFASNSSSTYVNPGTESFSTSYTDGYAYGEVMSETLGIGSAKISKLTMGIVESADVYIGVLGLGFNTTSSGTTYTGSTNMQTVPDRLLQDGQIQSTAYSLWLDDDSGASGSILLGAIDRSKFEEPLIRFPTWSTSSGVSSKLFDTTIVSVNGSKSSSDAFQPIGDLEDSYYYTSSSAVRISPHDMTSWLPSDLATDIYKLAGATYFESDGYYVVPCSANTSTARIALQLNSADGPVLDIPIPDLVLPQEMWHRYLWSWETESRTDYCLFGVQSYNSTSTWSRNTYTLGGTMLKRAYMVFDLANEEVAFAKTKFGTTDSSIIPFSSYAATIPESTAAQTNSCSTSSTGCNHGGGGNDGSGYGDGYSYYAGLSSTEIRGIIIGVVVFAVVTLGLTIWAVLRCRRIRRAEAELAKKQDEEGAVIDDSAQQTTEGQNSMSQQPPPVVNEKSAPHAAVAQHPGVETTTPDRQES